jgi:hypothetical protein
MTRSDAASHPLSTLDRNGVTVEPSSGQTVTTAPVRGSYQL